MRIVYSFAIILLQAAGVSQAQAQAYQTKYHANINTVFVAEKNAYKISVIPSKLTTLNLEAPWKLSLYKQGEDLKTVSERTVVKEIDVSQFNSSESAFFIPLSSDSLQTVKTSSLAKTIPFQLVYFVCDTKKTWCKRFIHEQK